jgi:CO/xanthine dehydrogenase FAD-binding subunit
VTARGSYELDARVRSRFAPLAESAAMVGSVQVRNLATLAAICAMPRPRPTWPAAHGLDAEAVIAGPSGHAGFDGLVLPGVASAPCSAPRAAPRDRRPAQGAHSGGNYLRTRRGASWTIAVVAVASQVTLPEESARRPGSRSRRRARPLRATGAEQRWWPAIDPAADRAGGRACIRRRAPHRTITAARSSSAITWSAS